MGTTSWIKTIGKLIANTIIFCIVSLGFNWNVDHTARAQSISASTPTIPLIMSEQERPNNPSSYPPQPTAEIPSPSDLNKAFQAQLNYFINQVAPNRMFTLSEILSNGEWAFAVAQEVDINGEYIHHQFIVLLGKQVAKDGWRVLAPIANPTQEYNALLHSFPDELINENTKVYLTQPELTDQTMNFSGHKLPWPAGQIGYVTQKDGESHQNQVDFDILDSSTPGDVFSTKPGTVIFVKEISNSGSCNFSDWEKANLVVVQHSSSEYSWYFHLAYNSIPVSVGNTIGFGTKIGVEGNTGYACGVHLHYMASNDIPDSWTNPSDPNAAPWPPSGSIVATDFDEVSWANMTVGQGYYSQNNGTTCPQSGGVILYWNANYNCDNNQGDAGYRQITTIGLHNVNDGQFNDNASSLKVPSGWSARLHEHENGGGSNICYNSDISDFSTQGSFPGTSTPINDNVSSVTVYDNTSCSENDPPTPGPGEWYVEYFNDTTLTNKCSPTLTSSGPFNFQDWGDGNPYSGCNSDNWSARFWRTVHFQSGTYEFGLGSDDWSRLIIDGDLVLNNWQGAGQHYASRTYSEGDRQVTVEFADTLGSAKLAAWWWGPGYDIPRETRDPYQWYAQYWGNKDLWWDSIVRVNEGTGSLNHQWDSNGPGYGLPADKFSSRFERQMYFSCGTYRFNLSTDDGVRFWIDGTNRVDEWQDQVADFSVDVDISEGYHELKVEHYENGGGATVSLNWSRLLGCSPNPPSDLVAETVSQSQIDLTWTDNASNEDGFELERSLDGSTGWTLITTLGANTNSYSDTGLSQGTIYYYRVRAFNTIGTSSYSNTANATTLRSLAAPSDLAASTVSQSQIDLTWTDNSGDESDFHVERSPKGCAEWEEVATIGANITSFSDSGLSSGTNYCYRVSAYRANDDIHSDYSNVVDASTIGDVPAPPGVNNPPYEPSNPSPANGVVDQSVDMILKWTGGDPDGDAVSYDVYLRIEGSSMGGPMCNDISDTTCDPGALSQGTTYEWWVMTEDEHGAATTGPVWNFNTTAVSEIIFDDFDNPSSNPNLWDFGKNQYGPYNIEDGTLIIQSGTTDGDVSHLMST